MSTICITGATDGIGLATTRRLLQAGHRVLVHARSVERGRTVLADLAGDAVGVTGDLSSLAEVRSLAAQILEHGPLDVLVHNAGVWVRGATPPLSADGFETTFAVNVLAPHLLTTLLVESVGSRLIWLGSGWPAPADPTPTTWARRRIRPGRTPTARPPTSPWRWPGVAGCPTWPPRLSIPVG